jgi:hypothetical protein
VTNASVNKSASTWINGMSLISGGVYDSQAIERGPGIPEFLDRLNVRQRRATTPRI